MLVLTRSITIERMFCALVACAMLAACGERDQPQASSSMQSTQSIASSSPIQQADAPALPGSSDIQRWALQQTQPSVAPPSLPQETPAAAASDVLLPPVIHTAE
jgi:hypothetical protein